ncbi:MAG: winged helix-turn-helix domain-containing protein [Candidatus Wallbacteria bacterium]
MEATIGSIAGKVWHYLHEKGPSSFKQVKLNIFKDNAVAMDAEKLGMAIGWLLKEGKINMVENGSGKGYRLTLSLKESN